ncbi:MAG: preprotein translocase subunit SecG [Burkholderiaceae bacterium]|jgi:preprotein translocase subunit SecG|nr:preprotein translocase subunit SecG [Aquabacterium sp.]NUP84794.1 preprotein translocase subunit SecG [Burkholderiaceae bacterium]
MQIWMNFVLVVQLVAALAMIGLVLVQHGKGADMGASFGSGASGSLFGATGSANFLSRSTAVCATIFFACTLLMAILTNTSARAPGESAGSALDRPAAASAASAAAPAAVIPGAAPAPAVAPSASAASAVPAGTIPTR